jgi:hypothetical protein
MSDDKTEISGNDDPTVEIEVPTAPTTNMMIETLLLEVRQFRAETSKRFDGIEQKINILNERILDLDAKQRQQELRLLDLERKAS